MARHHRYQELVERFEGMARANLGKLNHVAELCAAVAASQRTLERAVRAVHGTTPLRHLRALRLAEVRRALLSAPGRAETVTEVAMRFGFRELGRFAADYRAAFAESPSETLRRAAGDCPDPTDGTPARRAPRCPRTRPCPRRDLR